MALRKDEDQPDVHMKWEFPGGKIEFGETPEDCLKREFLEETGMEISIKQLLPFSQTNYWDSDWGKQQVTCFVYLCELVAEHEKPEDHHVEKTEWIPIDDVSHLDSLPGTGEVIAIVKKMVNR